MIFKKIYIKIENILNLLRLKLRVNLVFSTLKIHGMPDIFITKTAKVILGDNVTLNSKNKGYHVNMFRSVKILADRPNAFISIGENTRIHGTCIHAHKKITIGKRCLIAANCQIIDSSGHDLSFENVENRIKTSGIAKSITIQDDVWLGMNCIILPGVTIGKGSIVAAGSVVAKSIPEMCIVGGNPARIIKSRRG